MKLKTKTKAGCTVCVTILVSLGSWQLRRLEWKSAIVAEIAAAAAAIVAMVMPSQPERVTPTAAVVQDEPAAEAAGDDGREALIQQIIADLKSGPGDLEDERVRAQPVAHHQRQQRLHRNPGKAVQEAAEVDELEAQCEEGGADDQPQHHQRQLGAGAGESAQGDLSHRGLGDDQGGLLRFRRSAGCL